LLKALAPGETVRDDLVKGFVARRLRDGRVSFECRRQGADPLQRVIGHDDVLTIANAREAARKILGQHALGLYKPKERGGLNLDAAWDLWRADLVRRERSPRTVKAYGDSLARLEQRVRRLPLRALCADPSIMLDEFERIEARSETKRYRQVGHGKQAALSSARFVRGLVNYVRRRHDPSLAGNPCADINLESTGALHELEVMNESDLPRWHAAVRALENPIRQECFIFGLLSGLRRTSLLEMRWEHFDEASSTFHIPRPKGGRGAAFDLILSPEMMGVLDRVRGHLGILVVDEHGGIDEREPASPWVWPGKSKAGHISGMESDRKRGVFCGLHGCRRTYSSIARVLGVEEDLIGRLLNHRGKGARVTSHYVRTSAIGKLLVDAQRRISEHIATCLRRPVRREAPMLADAAPF
jgi:integrase